MNKFPLKDGDKFETGRGGVETVMGEIKPEHRVKGGICWTLQGNWYRRRDGEQMTAWNGEVMTAREFFKRRRKGTL